MEVNLVCECCKNIFVVPYKQRKRKYCSRECYFKFAVDNKIIGKKKDPEVREDRTCVECGEIFNERKKYDRKLCSNECRNVWNLREENKLDRINKGKETMVKIYGVDSIFKDENFKKNLTDNFLKKYGTTHPMHVPEFVTKLKNTVRGKHLINLLPKLKENELELLDEYTANKNFNTSKSYNFKCNVCDNIFTSTLMGSGKIPICRKCNPLFKNSKIEQLIKDFLNEKNIKHLDNDRKILDGKEIDIFLPDYNIGLEVNGNYYHSEINGEKTKYYHIDKTNLSESKNIKLIHICEDEILLKTDIVLSKISSLLNLNKTIYGRKCVIKEISKKESTLFLNENHLQGNSIDKYRYGLYYNDEIVSILTFGKKRKSLGNKSKNENEYELVRFCNKKYTNVIGGFSKLLKYFIKNHLPTKIETFADIRWSGVNPKSTVYYNNGFNFIRQTPPNYWYVQMGKYMNRYHRFTFRKDVLIKEGYDKKMTEWEIMKLKEYDRIWDCGSLKFEMNI